MLVPPSIPEPASMQAIARFPASRRGPSRTLARLPVRPAATLAAACTRFIAHDRDRWVSVVCGAGFVLLMWVDWLAA